MISSKKQSSIGKRVQQVHEKWVNVRTLLQNKLINVVNIHVNPDFKFLAECTEWVQKKYVSLQEIVSSNVSGQYRNLQKILINRN